MSLNIISWNAQSFQNKIFEFRNYLNSLKKPLHIILIQETWLTSSISIELAGYTCIRADRPTSNARAHGGVLIFIANNIRFKRVNFTNLELTEGIFIEIYLSQFTFKLGCVYSSSGLSRHDAKLDYKRLLSKPGPFLLAGDFNAKHIEWNNSTSNRKGLDLFSICDSNHVNIHFPDHPTLFPDNCKATPCLRQ